MGLQGSDQGLVFEASLTLAVSCYHTQKTCRHPGDGGECTLMLKVDLMFQGENEAPLTDCTAEQEEGVWSATWSYSQLGGGSI